MHGFDVSDVVPVGHGPWYHWKLALIWKLHLNLPPNLGGLRAEDYFEQNWLRDVSASFRINTVEASVIPAASYSGMAVIEGIASADATTLAANDTAVVSLLACTGHLS